MGIADEKTVNFKRKKRHYLSKAPAVWGKVLTLEPHLFTCCVYLSVVLEEY